MARNGWVALGLIAATPAGAQLAPPAHQPGAAPADSVDDGGALTALNRQALSATASQTARIAQDTADNARQQAAYVQAQADYQRSLRRYEAETATAAAHAAEYQRNLAAWKAKTDWIAARQTAPPARAGTAAATTAAADPASGPAKRICTAEAVTGSRFPVQHYRTIEQVAARQARDERDKDAMLRSFQSGAAMPGH